MSRLTSLALASITLMLGACSHVAPRYGASVNNVEAIRSIAAASPQKLSVVGFTTFEDGLRSISCRAAGPVEPPNGFTYEKYIEDALVSELKLAGLFSPDSGAKLHGHLDYISFNSNIGAGKWQIDMTFSGDSVAPFKVNTVYPFSTNFLADIACNQVASALPVAVQELLTQLIAHPSFKQVINTSVRD